MRRKDKPQFHSQISTPLEISFVIRTGFIISGSYFQDINLMFASSVEFVRKCLDIKLENSPSRHGLLGSSRRLSEPRGQRKVGNRVACSYLLWDQKGQSVISKWQSWSQKLSSKKEHVVRNENWNQLILYNYNYVYLIIYQLHIFILLGI